MKGYIITGVLAVLAVVVIFRVGKLRAIVIGA